MAMVEMVFVLPVLLLLMFAIAEFGLMFSRWLTLSNAVREGARHAVVYRNPCTQAAVVSEVQDRVETYAAAGGVDVQGNVTVNGACQGSDTQAVVSADYVFEFQVVPGLSFFSVGPDITLTYSSTMRNE